MTDPSELEDMTDDELLVLAEEAQRIVRVRSARAAIPAQIASLARTFRDGGGGEDALQDALTPEQRAELDA